MRRGPAIHRRRISFAAAILSIFASGAAAQDGMPKVVTIIVPYPAGGLGDIMPRTMAEVLNAETGRTFVIDNKPGATQSIGVRAAALAKPDGATLLFGSVSSLVINPAMKSRLPYDPIADFEPIFLAFISPTYLIGRRELPPNTMAELIAFARAKPGKLTYASGGFGSTSHLSGELLKTAAGIDMVHVPYAGTGPAVRDVIGGHVDLTFTASGLSYGDQVKVLAVTGARRAAAARGVGDRRDDSELRGDRLVRLPRPRRDAEADRRPALG